MKSVCLMAFLFMSTTYSSFVNAFGVETSVSGDEARLIYNSMHVLETPIDDHTLVKEDDEKVCWHTLALEQNETPAFRCTVQNHN